MATGVWQGSCIRWRRDRSDRAMPGRAQSYAPGLHRQSLAFVNGRYEQDRYGGFEYPSSPRAGLAGAVAMLRRSRSSVQLRAGYRWTQLRDSLSDDGVTAVARERSERRLEPVMFECERLPTSNTQLLGQQLCSSLRMTSACRAMAADRSGSWSSGHWLLAIRCGTTAVLRPDSIPLIR